MDQLLERTDMCLNEFIGPIKVPKVAINYDVRITLSLPHIVYPQRMFVTAEPIPQHYSNSRLPLFATPTALGNMLNALRGAPEIAINLEHGRRADPHAAQGLGGQVEIRQSYIPALFPQIVRALIETGVSQSAVEVIGKMDEYYLSKEDWDTIVELGVDEEKDD
ncbi:hypothetical protein B0H11DRAFT_2237663 [Mycena galericulata]|nr:hypothetical protein B0H11DRAFT_2237663 [Mycena galericulata]